MEQQQKEIRISYEGKRTVVSSLEELEAEIRAGFDYCFKKALEQVMSDLCPEKDEVGSLLEQD